ncbi:MAG: hypothetical protein CL609_09225 [Anaerolineaceae bacterium]|nr:hypothetical protein [Anaerolineaceae bacterium]
MNFGNKKINISLTVLIAFSLSSFLFILLLFSLRSWSYDDPYITYRYAENLAAGRGLVFNIGERVLSTTTPFFALLLAALHNPYVSTHALANGLGAFSLAYGGFLLWLILRHQEANYAAWLSLLLFPIFPSVIKTISSETPLYIFTGLLTIYLYQIRKFNWSAFFAGLIVLIRPDGLILPGLLIIINLIQHRKIPFKYGLIVLFVNLPWLIFAWLYFGLPIPITLNVKQSQGVMQISQLFAPGFLDLIKQFLSQPIYWIHCLLFTVGLVFLIVEKKIQNQIVLFWVVLYFLAYTIMGVTRYFWYYAPLFPAIIILIGLGLEWLKKISPKTYQKYFATSLMLFLFIFQLNVFFKSSQQFDKRVSIYKEIGIWLNQYTDETDTIGLLEVGIIGYYADRTMIDFAGLIKPEVAKSMQANTTYQDTAKWAVEKYHPNYLVLHEGFISQDLLTNHFNCLSVKQFEGDLYNYSTMIIYKCNWPGN